MPGRGVPMARAALLLAVMLSGCAATPCPPCTRPAAAASPPPPAQPRAVHPSWGLGDKRLSFDGLNVWNSKEASGTLDMPWGNTPKTNKPRGTELMLRFTDPARQLVGIDQSGSRMDRWNVIGRKVDFAAKAQISVDSQPDAHTLEISIDSPRRPALGALGFNLAGVLTVQYVASAPARKQVVILKKGDASPHPVVGQVTLSRTEGKTAPLVAGITGVKFPFPSVPAVAPGPVRTIVRLTGSDLRIGALRVFDANGVELHALDSSFSMQDGKTHSRVLSFKETKSPIRVVVPIHTLATETVKFKGAVGLGF